MEPNALENVNGIMEMLSRMDKATPIDESLIETGCIFKAFIYEDEECSVSMLLLSPGARIKKHKHNVDSEVYYIFKDRKFETCKVGESHSLENPYSDWMPVLSIKYKI